MCGGVQYTDKANKTWNIYFPNPKATLPILKRTVRSRTPLGSWVWGAHGMRNRD
jgi:hypothetical protein